MQIAGMVLAGGASRRMGRDKLSLPLAVDAQLATNGQRTILQHVVEAVVTMADSVTVLGPPNADFAALHRNVFDGENVSQVVNIVCDDDYYKGPLTALADAWPSTWAAVGREVGADVSNDVVLVVAGDYPGLDETVLAAVIRMLVDAEKLIDGAVVRRNGVQQPLLACYRGEVGAAFREAVAQGESRLMTAVGRLHLAEVDADMLGWPEWWTRPVHTPEDYEAWLRRLQDGMASHRQPYIQETRRGCNET